MSSFKNWAVSFYDNASWFKRLWSFNCGLICKMCIRIMGKNNDVSRNPTDPKSFNEFDPLKICSD